MRRYGFSWVIEGELAAMAMPDGVPGDWQELRGRGVTALVNLSDEGWPEHVLAENDLEYLHLPIRVFWPPRPDQVDTFVDFCERIVWQGGAVAVHCVAGMGRTGTMAACYLVHRGMEPQEAIDEIRRKRPGSIETEDQEAAVHAFARRRKERAESQGHGR